MNKICLSVDIGSKNIVIAGKESQILLNEPCVVATAILNSKFENVACGREALSYINKNNNAQLIYPIKNGSVDNEVAFVYLLKTFINRLAPKKFLKNYVSVIASVSCGLNNIEKRMIEEAFYKAGVKEVVIVESPLSVKAINNDKAMFLINIGSSNTEIAIVSDDGIINACSINVGGDNIDYAIIDYIGEKYKLIVSKTSSEDIKLGLATLEENDLSVITILGRSVLQSTNSEVKITATELRPLVQSVIDKIVEVVASVCMMIPKAYLNIIEQSGFYLAGGGSKLTGLANYFKDKLFVDIKIIDQPEFVVAQGGSKFFYDKGKLARMLNIDNLN